VTAPDPVRAGRALGGAAAGILALEGIATLFVPRGIAQSGDGLTGFRLVFLLVLALLLILAAVRGGPSSAPCCRCRCC
jgi:hypothetical protein